MKVLRTSARRSVQSTVKTAATMFDRLVPPVRGGVVLIYHRVGRRSLLEVDLPDSLFDEQMAVLGERNRVCTIDDALVRLAGEPSTMLDPVVVTFDDGTVDFVECALPILVRHQIPAVLYIATDFIERGLDFPDEGKPVSWAALADALGTGLVTIGSHTHTHSLLDRADGHAAALELDASIGMIEDRLGVAASHFAYPKALRGNRQAAAEVRSRFVSAAVAGTRPNAYGKTDPYNLARSPIQFSDGMKFFSHKLAGGMRVEDDVRQIANRVRYVGATK